MHTTLSYAFFPFLLYLMKKYLLKIYASMKEYISLRLLLIIAILIKNCIITFQNKIEQIKKGKKCDNMMTTMIIINNIVGAILLHRIGTNPLEHHFGLIRQMCHYILIFKKFVKSETTKIKKASDMVIKTPYQLKLIFHDIIKAVHKYRENVSSGY